MDSPLLAGLVAGIPLAFVLILYTLVRGKALVRFFQSQDESMARMSSKTFFLLLLASFTGMAFVFGAIAGLVYGRLGSPAYQYVALGATLLFSVFAVVSRQPLPGDKIAMNVAVGGVLGTLVPLLMV